VLVAISVFFMSCLSVCFFRLSSRANTKRCGKARIGLNHVSQAGVVGVAVCSLKKGQRSGEPYECVRMQCSV